MRGPGKKGAEILIMSLNVNGLRQKRKINAPRTYIVGREKQPDVCILVETHLSEEGTESIVLPTY